MKPLTLADGKRVYDKYCSVCHTPGSAYLNAPALGDKQAWAPLIKKGIVNLFMNVTHGHGNMAPKGGCTTCTDADLVAATKYMVHESKSQGNYTLW